MKNIYSFILGIFVGLISVWGIIPLLIKLFFLIKIYPPDALVFSSPVIFCIIAAFYFIWKKKGFIPIAGLILGYVVGIILLMLGLGLGDR